MTTLSPPGLALVAFGNLGAELWGAAMCASESIVIAGGFAHETAASPASLEGTDSGADWRLLGDGIELVLSPESDAVEASGPGGFDQLCRVRGDTVLDGEAQTIDCVGRRAARAAAPAGERYSIRDFSAWFDSDDGVALTALRPGDANGHGRDAISAALFEPAGAEAVADPRLSTTYSDDGVPLRVSLELWLEQEEEGDAESFPRRVAGEALGPTSSVTVDDLTVQARPFRCFGHGLEGIGVYVLGRTA